MSRSLAVAAALAVLILAPGAARAGAPFAFASTPGSLPKNVVPVDYDISLRPNADARTSEGDEKVSIKILSATKTIVVNTNKLGILSASLRDGTQATISTNAPAQQTTLTFPRVVAAGTNVLSMAFAGAIEESSEGLFAVRYRTPDGPKTMLLTQFESTDARRVFPSWDEPAFKATFRIRATLPAEWTAFSNMPVASRRDAGEHLTETTFQRTPRMSSYLVVLCAGELDTIEGAAGGTSLRIVTARGKSEQARYALGVAESVLPYYNVYFGTHYPLPKLDLIVIPGGFAGFGAMENWGGITFADRYLLFDPATDPESKKEEIFNTIAHEMAHQWFGDLVTMAWWDDIWLNEGFASWMATKASDRFNPEWHVWENADFEKSTAMQGDGRVTTHPIQQRVVNPAEIDGLFDDITYLKGQTFIHMTENFLGEVPFRNGIRAYMKAHAYSNATTADLWTALGAASKKPVARIATSWIQQPGYPLVTVDATCRNGRRRLHATQERFFNEPGNRSDLRWQIPLGMRIGSGTKAAGSIPLFGSRTATIAGGSCKEPFFVNPGDAGYYRVAYDPRSFAAISARLGSLPVLDRLSFLDDAEALVSAQRLDAGAYLALVRRISNETNENVWARALAGIQQIAAAERGQPGEAALKSYVRALLEPAFTRIGWGPQSDLHARKLQAELIRALGEADDPAVIDEARKRFEAFARSPETLAPYLRGPVVRIVARNADAATYDRIAALLAAAKSETEVRTFLFALSAPRDPALAERTLEYSIGGRLPPEAGTAAPFWLAHGVAEEHPKLAFDFIQEHASQLIAGFDPLAMRGLPQASIAFWRAAPDAELEAFIKKNDPGEPPSQIARAMESIKAARARAAFIVPAADRWLAANASTAAR